MLVHAEVSAGILTARGLAKRYGRRKLALDGIDLEIRPGTITVLVGPNGAGKSTLMKAWVGFERPSQGQVSVAGIDPWRRAQRAAALQHIGYVPQEPALYRELTIAQHVALAASLRAGFDPELAQGRLEDLGLDVHTRIAHLSGGQHAQVSLALALAAGGEILILDEPLAGLDPLARREFLYLLRRAVDQGGLSAVLSSHVVTDIEQAGDHVIVLGAGRKLLDAPISEALAEHAIREGDDPAEGSDRSEVASFLGPAGQIVTLLRGSADRPGTRPTSIEELMLGYLATSRPSMSERIPTGRVGR